MMVAQADWQEGVMSFDDVEARLVEAWGFLRRMPDAEARFLQDAKASSIYGRGRLTEADVWTAFGWMVGVFAEDERPRLPGLRAAEVDRMQVALGWVQWVPERDRKLLGLALSHIDRGEAQIPWKVLAARMGWAGHPDALRKRYERAIARIAAKLARGSVPFASV